MYTAYIGRRLLDLHNRQNGKNDSARSFFDAVFFPCFFDDERYLMWVNNSPFDQAFKLRKKQPLTPKVRRERLAQLHAKAEGIEGQDGSILLGSAALGSDGPTSGQVTTVGVPVSTEDVYLSWIGAAAGVGVEGGFSMLFDDDRVLSALMEGWTVYRELMDSTPYLKAHQIDTWNGWWLIHRFSKRYEPDAVLPEEIFGSSKDPGRVALATAPWSRVVFALAHERPDRALPAYIYTFGNTNKTVGFIQLHLPRVDSLRSLYAQLFGSVAEVRERGEIEMLYETQFSFIQACRQGSIGLQALEPRKLREYMPTGRSDTRLPKPPATVEARVTFAIYETWIIAMLSNNERLLELAQATAETLYQYTGSAARAKATPKRLVESTLGAGDRKKFIKGLTEILENDPTHGTQFEQLIPEILKTSDFPLLLTLIKFKYVLARQRGESTV